MDWLAGLPVTLVRDSLASGDATSANCKGAAHYCVGSSCSLDRPTRMESNGSQIRARHRSVIKPSANKSLDSNLSLDTQCSHKIINQIVESSNQKANWWFYFSLVTIVAFATRLYKISEPNHVWYVSIICSFYM